MRKILQEISKKTLLLNEREFSDEQLHTNWLGNAPATDLEIEAAQKNLQIKLPGDYIEFLKITNGFPQCITTGVTFSPIEKVDYLINVDEDLVEIWNQHKIMDAIGQALSQSLIISGLNEEQCFLLIPPKSQNEQWRYWKFASWLPGEHEFKDMRDYFKDELAFLKKETKGLKKPKSKFIRDYSLRDHVFNSEWEKVFETAYDFLINRKYYGYYNPGADLLSILLLASGKLNNFEIFIDRISELKAKPELGIGNILEDYESAAKNKLSFVDKFQFNKFLNREPSITIDQIEEQIKACRKDLLKPKNIDEKVDYQFYFLFEYGNSSNFIKHYEANLNSPFSNSHLKAAIVFATINQIDKAKKAMERYFDLSFDYTPLEPFLDSELSRIMDNEFSKQILIKMRGKYLPT